VSNETLSFLEKLNRAADEIGKSWYRIGLANAAIIYGFFGLASLFTRLLWRLGYAEPASRFEYAFVETMANGTALLLFAVVLFVFYSTVRRIGGYTLP